MRRLPRPHEITIALVAVIQGGIASLLESPGAVINDGTASSALESIFFATKAKELRGSPNQDSPSHTNQRLTDQPPLAMALPGLNHKRAYAAFFQQPAQL